MRRVSVAEAKAKLPRLLREVDRSPDELIEVTRHGVVVGAIVGTKGLEKLRKPVARDPYAAWSEWREKRERGVVGDTDDLLSSVDDLLPEPHDFS